MGLLLIIRGVLVRFRGRIGLPKNEIYQYKKNIFYIILQNKFYQNKKIIII